MRPLLFLFYLCMQIESSTVMAPNSLQLEIWTNGHGPWVQGSFKKFSDFSFMVWVEFFQWKSYPCSTAEVGIASHLLIPTKVELRLSCILLYYSLWLLMIFLRIILSPSMGSATTQPTKCSLNCLPPPSHANIIRHLRWQRGGEFLIGSFFSCFLADHHFWIKKLHIIHATSHISAPWLKLKHIAPSLHTNNSSQQRL